MSILLKSRKSKRITPFESINFSGETPLSIFVVTDLHISSESPDQYHARSRQRLINFVDIVNQEKPDICVWLGDNVNRPPLIGDDNDYDFVINEWNRITTDVEKIVCLGNHDYGDGRNESDFLNGYGYQDNDIIAGSRFTRNIICHKSNVSLLI